MMVLENEDNDTIAEIMGISAVNVRVKIHRVKKHLEKFIHNELMDELLQITSVPPFREERFGYWDLGGPFFREEISDFTGVTF